MTTSHRISRRARCRRRTSPPVHRCLSGNRPQNVPANHPGVPLGTVDRHTAARLILIVAPQRFIVTNLTGDPTFLYDGLHGARGEAQNRSKEAQLYLFGARASCRRFAANQLRLLLAALAYTLMQRLRALALQGTELQSAYATTIRVRLLKIGEAIIRNTRHVRVKLASHHPLRALFSQAVIDLDNSS